jgi:hypothetical protein
VSLRLLLAVLIASLIAPSLAAAHTGAGTAVDYQTVPEGLLDAAGQPVAGAEIAVYGGDDRLELRWSGPGEVVVLGYADEPYLRIGPDGAFENVRSPSVDSNRERFGTVLADESVDASAPPEWRKIGTEPVAVWHDHRSHWMSPGQPPPGVGSAPDVRQVVQTYSIPVLVDGEAASIPGELEYIPAPSPWPYVAAIFVLAGMGIVTVLWAPRGVAVWVARGVAAAGIVAGGALLVADAVSAPSGGLTEGTSEAIPPFVQAGLWTAVIAIVGALWARSARRNWAGESVVMLVGTLIVAGVAGLSRISYLDHAVIPGGLSEGVARALVVICLASLPVPVAWAWRIIGALRARDGQEHDGRQARPTPRKEPAGV